MNRIKRHRRQGKGLWVWLLLTVALLWLWVIGPTVADAHAILLRSIPEANTELAQAPATIEMWFSEPLEAGFSTARLLDSEGQEIPTGAVNLDPSDLTHMTLPLGQLEPGIYTVAWQTLSQADGHEWYGSFPLTLLNPDGSRPTNTSFGVANAERGELPSPGEVISRWLVLLGGILLFGLPLFQIVVAQAGGNLSSPNTITLAITRDLALRAVWIAVAAIVVGSCLQIILQALRLGGVDQLPTLLLETRTGRLALVRQAVAFIELFVVMRLPQPWPLRKRERLFLWLSATCGALVIGLLLFTTSPEGRRIMALVVLVLAGLEIALARFTPHDAQTGRERRTWYVLLALSGVMLLTLSLGSHANAVPGNIWAVLGDYIHLVAAATWVGGLTLLPILIWQVRRTAIPADPPQLLPLVRRFSFLASLAVFVLITSGLFSSLVELPSFSNLWDTPYGLVLLTKLCLMALALEVAFFNNRLVRLQARQLHQPAGLQRLQRQIVIETVLNLGVILTVAVLVQTPAPRSFSQTANATQPDLPFNIIGRADDLQIHIQVTPNQVGHNRFWTHLYHPDGSAIGEVQLVRLLFDYRQEQLGQARADLDPLGQDTFAVEGAYLNRAGAWDLSVYVRRRGRDDALTDVRVDVPPAIGQGAGSSPWENPVPGLPAGMVLAGVLVALGLIPLLWRQPLQDISNPKASKPKRQTRALSATALSSGIIMLVGLLIAAASTPALLARLNPGGEPVPTSPSSITAGAELYQEQCAVCHGAEGLGDGPQAATLQPPPANMRIHVPLHDNRELYRFISEGFPGTAMPAFADGFTQDEIWHLVNFLRAKFG